MLHESFLDLTSGPIGRVVTSEENPATAHEFFFWTAETEAAQNLDIGHIVAAEFALGTEDFSGHSIPMLLHENGNERDGSPQRTPLYVDEEYLLGPEAGHLNITGMSGLSTKTSHALFTIASTFQTIKDKRVEVSAEDDPELAERYAKVGQRGLPREDREMYESLGIEIKPFENLRIFAPLRYGMESGERIVHAEGIPARKLKTLRNARGEDSQVYPIIWELGDVLPYAGYVFEPSDMDDKFRGFIEELRDRGVRTTADFYSLLDEIEDYFEAAREDGKNVSSWNGHNHMTIAKVKNRFKVLPNKCGGLLAHGRVEHGALPRADGPFEDNEMRVVDISQLTGVPQDLIVTSVISKIWELAETGRLGVDKLIIFVDELNKYAPTGNSRTSSLKDTLVDISARGRHLNLTLFGAQQFRSKVDDEVIGNAATSLYGRIGDEELTNASYRSFSGTTREELLQLEKGQLLLRHAHYAVPVFGRFPRPPVLMGKQGTDIFGSQRQDPASSVLAVMRNLTARPPATAAIRTEIEGVPEEQVYEALDAVQAAHRTGHGAADPYKNFRWNLKRPVRTTSGRRDASRILSGLDRMRD